MHKPDVALFIYKTIDEALLKVTRELAKKYLEPLKDKSWYDKALTAYEALTLNLLDEFKEQSKAYAKLLKGSKEVYKKKVSLSDIKYSTEENLDEMYNHVVVDDIKDILDEMKNDFKSTLEKIYEDQDRQLIIEAAKLTAKNIGFKFNFNQFDKHTRDYLRDKKINWAKTVQSTTEKSIKSILVRGFEEGLGSYDIADLIQNNTNFSYRRSEAIARTEIISSCNYADNVIYGIDENVIGKEWSSTGDSRTRKSHLSANGQKVKKDKPFIIGSDKMMQPGDGSLGAQAKEIIACRCTIKPIFKGEKLM